MQYVRTYLHSHPRADNQGRVFAHIVVMERFLGRRLKWYGTGDPRSEIIHHKDGDVTNNHISNLFLTTYQDHPRIHANKRGHTMWKQKAREVAEQVWQEHKDASDLKTFKRKMREAYPFGERNYAPYKIWLRIQRTAIALYKKRHGID